MRRNQSDPQSTLIVELAELAGRWPIEVDSAFGCALWTGPKDRRDGRALVWRGKTPTVAYRAVFVAEVGEIEEGKVLDHLCRRPQCVAPHHLEAVTQNENEKRKSWRYRARRQLCPLGHDLKENGVVTPEGGRVCRACNQEAMGDQREVEDEARNATTVPPPQGDTPRSG